MRSAIYLSAACVVALFIGMPAGFSSLLLCVAAVLAVPFAVELLHRRHARRGWDRFPAVLFLLAFMVSGCGHGHYVAGPLADPVACAKGIAQAAVDQLPCDHKKPDPETCAEAAVKAALSLSACVPPLHWVPDAPVPMGVCK